MPDTVKNGTRHLVLSYEELLTFLFVMIQFFSL